MINEPHKTSKAPYNQIDFADHAGFFERIAGIATAWTGSTAMFISAIGLILVWFSLGPHFHFSDTWLLLADSGTAITTFLMVFLIQRSHNRDMLAIKIHMSELIASLQEANNQVIDLEHLSERQLAELHRRYQQLSHSEDVAPSHPTP